MSWTLFHRHHLKLYYGQATKDQKMSDSVSEKVYMFQRPVPDHARAIMYA